MDNFTAHRLHFACEVQTPIQLNEYVGSALRGALFHALRNQFCLNSFPRDGGGPGWGSPLPRDGGGPSGGCAHCPLHPSCPICFLVATVDDESDHGQEVPRPYVIVPCSKFQVPGYVEHETWNLERLQSGNTLEFGLTLFAQALNLFPYVVLAVKQMEQAGLGRKYQNPQGFWQRGRFRVQQILAQNPLTGQTQPILQQGDTLVQVPDIPITHVQVVESTNQRINEWAGLPLGASAPPLLRLDFLTPTRLIDQGQLVRRPNFRVLFQRLLERLDALDRRFAGGGIDPAEQYRLVGLAKEVRLVQDDTRWVELTSFSSRQGQRTPISGFLGQAIFQGDLSPFLPYLLWGQFTHAGKDAVKGNGLYQLDSPFPR